MAFVLEELQARLNEFITNHLGISVRKFEESCGLSNGVLAASKTKGPTTEILSKIIETFPELNLNWLLRGDDGGAMLNTASSAGAPAVNIEHIHTINIGNWSELVDLLRK